MLAERNGMVRGHARHVAVLRGLSALALAACALPAAQPAGAGQPGVPGPFPFRYVPTPPQPLSDEDRDPLCAMRPPAPEERVVLLGVYGGAESASVSVAGGEDTHVADIVVEPGKEPLYVVLASYEPMVWRFGGEVGRISHVFASSQVGVAEGGEERGGVGLVGVPAASVRVPGSRRCLPGFHEVGSAEHAAAAGAVEKRAGRYVDAVGATHSARVVGIPSMTMAAPPREPMGLPPTRGAVRIDRATVLSATPVTDQDPLPGDAGLRDMVAQGVIAPIPGTDIAYRVLKPFERLPVGLNGSYRRVFVLSPGIPWPGGKAGASCVVDGASGAPVAGTFCMADDLRHR